MSKIIGTLSKGFDARAMKEFFKGSIVSRSFTGTISLVPIPYEGKPKAGSPEFRVKEKYNGKWLECGAAWVKKSANVDGGEYMSITIDTDDMPAPFYCAAFPQKEQPSDDFTEWNIVWGRPRGPGGMRRAPSEGPDFPDDEIPY